MIPARKYLGALLIATAGAVALAGPAAALPTYTKMAAVGDSYTQGSQSKDFGDACGEPCPQNSWSTGNNPLVDSQLLRLRRSGSPSLTPVNYAVSGSTSENISAANGQADDAGNAGAQYVTVLIGLNDYCGQGGKPVTSLTDFRLRMRRALLEHLAAAKRIFVASVFDATRFQTIYAGSPTDLAKVAGKCPNYANPAARSWVDGYNAQLKQTCAEHPNCVFDEGAVSNWQYTAADIAADSFHLSRTGQRDLAALTFPVAFAEPKDPPPPPAFKGCPATTINTIIGTSNRNPITGTVRADRILARAGNDTVDGLAGDDCIDLSLGNDIAWGGPGRDLIRGGSGKDRVSGGPDPDVLSGGPNVDRITAGTGNDVVTGGSSNDALLGNSGNDRVNGDSGNDRLNGGAGRDRLSANSGNDKINSRDGQRDRVFCGKGRDRVTADQLDKVSRDCERVSRRRVRLR